MREALDVRQTIGEFGEDFHRAGRLRAAGLEGGAGFVGKW